MHLYGFLKMCTVLDISGELQQPGLPLPCPAAPAVSCMWRMPTPLQVQLLCLSDPDRRLSGEGTRVRGDASDVSAHNALLVRPDPYSTQAFSQPRPPSTSSPIHSPDLSGRPATCRHTDHTALPSAVLSALHSYDVPFWVL